VNAQRLDCGGFSTAFERPHSTLCRMQFGDTAEFNSALRITCAFITPRQMSFLEMGRSLQLGSRHGV
jgi:hypothetical protein